MYFEAKNIFVTYDHVRAVSDITLEMDEGATSAGPSPTHARSRDCLRERKPIRR